jgi:AMMECR1 domain-containing protein
LSLAPAERARLLALARGALFRAAGKAPAPAAAAQAAFDSARSAGHAQGDRTGEGGAFVTLRMGGALYGSVGVLTSPLPLGRLVETLAAAALRSDPRFEPLTPDALGEVVVEIALTSPPERVRDPDAVDPERHGLRVVAADRWRWAVVLPPVPLAQDGRQALKHACLRAGLSARAHADPEVTVERFQVERFSSAGSR